MVYFAEKEKTHTMSKYVPSFSSCLEQPSHILFLNIFFSRGQFSSILLLVHLKSGLIRGGTSVFIQFFSSFHSQKWLYKRGGLSWGGQFSSILLLVHLKSGLIRGGTSVFIQFFSSFHSQKWLYKRGGLSWGGQFSSILLLVHLKSGLIRGGTSVFIQFLNGSKLILWFMASIHLKFYLKEAVILQKSLMILIRWCVYW